MAARSISRSLLRFLARGGVAFFIVCGLVIYFQDYLVVPLAFSAANTGEPRDQAKLKAGFHTEYVTESDGVRIEVWSVIPKIEPDKIRGTVLYFGGNGEPVEKLANLSAWFGAMGLRSYFLSYRGTGRSEGAVSEQGFYRDAEALWEYAVTRNSLPASKVFVFSHSLGSGPAAYIAQTHNPGALVMLSPFFSLTRVVSEMPLYSLLTSFLHWSFPVSARIAALPNTCVVLAHGVRDEVVPVEHTRAIASDYKGGKPIAVIESADAMHNDILRSEVYRKIEKALGSCVGLISDLAPLPR